jgi:ribosomal protein L32
MVLGKHVRETWATGTYTRAGVLLLGNHIRVTLRTNTRCGKSIIPHTMLLSQNIHIRATLRRYIYSVREMLRTGVLLLGNYIRVTLRTNTRCGKSNIPHTPTGNKWFSESISGLLGQPVPTLVRYIPDTRAGALLLENHIRVTLRTNTRCGKSIIPNTQCLSLSKHTYPGCVKTVYTQ